MHESLSMKTAEKYPSPDREEMAEAFGKRNTVKRQSCQMQRLLNRFKMMLAQNNPLHQHVVEVWPRESFRTRGYRLESRCCQIPKRPCQCSSSWNGSGKA